MRNDQRKPPEKQEFESIILKELPYIILFSVLMGLITGAIGLMIEANREREREREEMIRSKPPHYENYEKQYMRFHKPGDMFKKN